MLASELYFFSWVLVAIQYAHQSLRSEASIVGQTIAPPRFSFLDFSRCLWRRDNIGQFKNSRVISKISKMVLLRQSTYRETHTKNFVSSILTFLIWVIYRSDTLFASYQQNKQNGTLASEYLSRNTHKKFCLIDTNISYLGDTSIRSTIRKLLAK